MSEGWQPTDDLEAPAPDLAKLVTEPRREPRQRSIRRPGTSARRPTGPRKPRKAPSKVPEPPSVQEALRGLLQMPAVGLIVAGQRAKSIPLVADGATILVHGPALADAIAEIAENDPRIMALLEKAITFGPYGGLVMVTLLMTAQFARNHGAPEEITSIVGAVSPEDIITQGGLDKGLLVPAPSQNGQREDDASPAV